jgi:hypothetical protein
MRQPSAVMVTLIYVAIAIAIAPAATQAQPINGAQRRPLRMPYICIHTSCTCTCCIGTINLLQLHTKGDDGQQHGHVMVNASVGVGACAMTLCNGANPCRLFMQAGKSGLGWVQMRATGEGM